MIIFVVIASILQIKDNNLNFLEKFETTTQNNSYFSAIALDDEKKIRNKSIYLGDELNFNDDEIRKKLKKIKVQIKDQELEPLVFSSDEYNISIYIKQTTLSIDKTAQKVFYRFSLDN